MDVLLISGGRAAHLQAVQNLYARMDKQKTSFLKLDSVGDVFAQAVSVLPRYYHASYTVKFCFHISYRAHINQKIFELQSQNRTKDIEKNTAMFNMFSIKWCLAAKQHTDARQKKK